MDAKFKVFAFDMLMLLAMSMTTAVSVLNAFEGESLFWLCCSVGAGFVTYLTWKEMQKNEY
jgi:hypothetical protein